MAGQFDELAKNLALGMSRREALRRFGFGLLGALLAALGLGSLAPEEARAQNSNCFYFCKAVYPNDPAAQQSCTGSGGLCSQCGPAAPPPRRSLCNAPGSSAVCCPTGQSCCNNTCTVCPTPDHSASVFCSGGQCGFTCQAGYTPSGSQCAPIHMCDNAATCSNTCPACGAGCCCFPTVEGGTACVNPTAIFSCRSSSECPSGAVCIVNPCTSSGFCVPVCAT